MKLLQTVAASAALALPLAFVFATPSAPPSTAATPTAVQRGEYLARAGDCMACHSVEGKPAFAGGLAIDSGHGIIYSSNITPDKQHGIGGYTEARFADALRKGVRADGTHLYPAMPYPSYAKVSDEDVHALYAYFMSLKPVGASAPATNMNFPFNLRWGMAIWNLFFASTKTFEPQPGWNAEVTRGAYLVEGLGHCGSCHTPRGIAMNEKATTSGSGKYLAGGELSGWSTPSLRGLPRWNEKDIVDYLQTGRNVTASVAGEMTSVVRHSTSYMTADDLQAVAVYLKSLPPGPAKHSDVKPQGTAETISRLTAAQNLTLGERLYLDNCAACHFVTGKGASRVFPRLDGATVINAENPDGLVHLILAGARTPSTDKAPSVLVMPGFAHRLSDGEVATLATFLRQGWSNQAAAVSERSAAEVRARITSNR